MTKIYTRGRTTKAWPKLALLGLLGLAAGNSYGQDAAQRKTTGSERVATIHVVADKSAQRQVDALGYPLNQAVNVAGTYTDLGSSGTLIATPNFDDANSAAQEIGFPFSYNGTSFTQFVLNTNGMIKLGATGLTDPKDVDAIINTTDQNVLAPASGIDLTGATDQTANPTSYRMVTTGAVGSRVCTIQFKNLTDKPNSTAESQFSAMQFQIKLYEANSTIEFVYGTWTSSGKPTASVGFLVGLKGASNQPAELALTSKGSAAPWSSTVFQNTVTQGGQTFYVGHFTNNAVLPDAGRTYRFRKTAGNDVAVATIYSLGKLPIPIGVPHVVSAPVRNIGSGAQTNVSVTMTVTGANTFTSTKTVAALATGTGATSAATVTFDAFTPTNLGTNTITIKVADDDNNDNNTKVFTQLVNPNTFAYAQPGLPAEGSIGYNTGSGILGNKYATNAARTVTGVTVRIGADENIVGNKVYGVVTDASGAILSRSPDYTVLAADLEKDKTFVVNAFVPAGSFIVGLAQTPNATSGYFPVGSQRFETPTRAGAYFSLPLAGGTPADQGAGNLGALMVEAVTDAAPTCPPPTGVTFTNVQATSALITFTGPANGTSYTIIYGPRGFDPAVSGTTVTATASPYTLTNLAPNTAYDVYFRTTCTATDQSTLVGPRSFTTPPTCPAPTGVTVTNVQPNSVVVTFVGPANGTSYSIIYGPKGFDPAVSGTTVTATASPFTLTRLVPSTAYDLYIRAICTAPDQSTLVGPRTFTTPCVPPIIATFPYAENFDGVAAGALPCGIQTANINNDAGVWAVIAGSTARPAASAPNHMRYNYNTANAADDWFFTPALALKAGTSYQLTFKYRAAEAKFPEGLEVKYGTTTTPADQTNLLWSNTAIANEAYATTTAGSGAGQVKAITPTISGNYYIGFHAISAKDQNALYVDDISVTATAITGSSAALQQAINIYPNPTEGNLKVDVRGANAKNGLQVEVTNMLGQRVHTETVRDNAIQTISLAKLANGMYTVKVLNGNEYMVRTISVQK